jgi:hypothetical protein
MVVRLDALQEFHSAIVGKAHLSDKIRAFV